jgi:hypothetical protein
MVTVAKSRRPSKTGNWPGYDKPKQKEKPEQDTFTTFLVGLAGLLTGAMGFYWLVVLRNSTAD